MPLGRFDNTLKGMTSYKDRQYRVRERRAVGEEGEVQGWRARLIFKAAGMKGGLGAISPLPEVWSHVRAIFPIRGAHMAQHRETKLTALLRRNGTTHQSCQRIAIGVPESVVWFEAGKSPPRERGDVGEMGRKMATCSTVVDIGHIACGHCTHATMEQASAITKRFYRLGICKGHSMPGCTTIHVPAVFLRQGPDPVTLIDCRPHPDTVDKEVP